MSKHDTTTTARAWTDAAFRRGLTQKELSGLPPNPAGLVELTDDELDGYAGAGMNPTIHIGPSWPGCR